ncbi:LOW QUALITY PROTEIN: enzymatic polyprotein endonuclease reverse [Vespula squamosa]|uniref:Enzymatic polyprotein endonuclease reverse n=1 Tax=Vespula squamosa TaxID=30214 RepID=A0ABD2BD72_VESSQ
MTANAERTATRLITNKLRGRALSAVESFDVQTIDKFCDLLRKVFGRHRIFQQYRAELSITYMIMENKLAEINEFAFCDGLPIDYRITYSTCKNLADAFDKALDYYTRLELDKFRYHENRLI